MTSVVDTKNSALPTVITTEQATSEQLIRAIIDALLFAPDDEEALAERIQSLLDSPERRAQTAEAGRRQAGRFSWSACVEKTAQVYRGAMEG
jgi:glycosyltransferase involved in cell wall biosynthesis